jgi:RNA polymerase sporulation-specific sigma factor
MRVDFNEYIQRAKQGDERAIESIVRIFKKLAWNKYKRMFGDDLSDAIQTGLMNMWVGIKTYDKTKNENAFQWLYATLDCGVVNYIKSKNRQKHRHLNAACSLSKQITYRSGKIDNCVTLEDMLPGDAVIENVVYNVYGEEEYKRLEQKLSPLERQVLHYRYLGCLKKNGGMKLIAQMTGVHVKAVDNAVQRIQRKAKYLSIGAIV